MTSDVMIANPAYRAKGAYRNSVSIVLVHDEGSFPLSAPAERLSRSSRADEPIGLSLSP